MRLDEEPEQGNGGFFKGTILHEKTADVANALL